MDKVMSLSNSNILSFNRIIIIGNNGSGKSFLAKELSEIMHLPLIHLDTLFWGPNWKMPSKEEWNRKIIELVSKDKWIIDGNVNHGNTMDLRFKAADLIIFLDINRFICLSSVFKRNGKKRSDTSQYSNEKIDMKFIKFCKGILNFSKTRKLAIMNLHEKYRDRPFIIINSRRKMNKLLNELK